MGALKKAVKAKAKTQPGPNTPVLSHPTEDEPSAPYRTVYNPPKPVDRFDFLKTFATIPGLRNKAKNNQQQ